MVDSRVGGDLATRAVVRCARRSGLRRTHGDESGNALVMAIAAVLLTGLLMGIVFSSVMFSVGHTTATRAQAASRASAEGGAQQVARALLQKSANAVTFCTTALDNLETLTNGLDYVVDEVSFRANAGDPSWVACTPTVGIPKMANAVRVKTTGSSKAVGQVGNSRGDDATVEMIFARPASLDFNKAVFGELKVNSNTKFNLYPDPVHPGRPNTELPPDIVTNNTWVCPASGTIYGSVFALGGATVSTDCLIKGNFYVSGKLHVGKQLTVEGNLYVNGNLETSSTFVNGTTLVKGDIKLSALNHKFLGPVRATGVFDTSDIITGAFASTLHIGGKITKPGSNLQKTLDGLGSKFQQQQSVTGPEWVLPSVLNTPENPKTEEDKAETKFPLLTKTDPMWDTFIAGDWEAMSLGSREGSRCTPYNFKTPIVISTATKVDLTDCPTVSWAGLTLHLKADLVVFVNDFTKNGDMTVRTVNAPGDESRHTLYIVALPTAGQTKCAAGQGGDITFQSNGWNQRDGDSQLRTKVMLYSAGKTKLSSEPSGTFNGQLYGCEVEVSSGIEMIFAKAGRDLSNSLWDLSLASVRDITD